MATNIPLKFRKKGYDSSDDGGEGIVVFNSDEKNIYVGGEKYGETKLAGLTDTEITSVADGQALVYDSTTSKWINDDINVDLAESITYSNLVSLISANSGAGSLVPGKLYRITDYVTTTIQTDTQSANHPFDLVVMATSPNTLDCQAKAVLHAGDTYFSNADLSKWQVWYDINNDIDKYDWADSTNGKGVIYRLIDEWDNDVCYDFKNILYKIKINEWGFYDPTNGTDNWVYTFNAYWKRRQINFDASKTSIDITIVEYRPICCNNIIMASYNNYYQDYGYYHRILNYNVFLNFYDDDDAYSNDNCCLSNVLYHNCKNNIFDSGCCKNILNEYCVSNIFGSGAQINVFGSDCQLNTFGNSCDNNTFGNSCQSNTFGNSCSENTFGDQCSLNTFGNSCDANTLANACISNTFGNYCGFNTLGTFCNNNTFGDSNNQNGDYIQYVTIESGNKCIRLYQTSGTAGSNNQLQNVYIAQGVNNTNTWLDISTIARNLSYRTTVGKESDGTLRIYNEDDKTALSGLSDVNIASASNGQILHYNSTSSKWENGDMNLKFDIYE